MIYAITIKTEYGKPDQVNPDSIILMPELSDDGSTVYAHSKEQALAWAKSQKAFANVEPVSLDVERFTLSSTWHTSSLTHMLFGYEEATHERQTLIICPANTVFESTGY